MIQEGTVIHGTHRPEDLIPAFMGEIEYHNPTRFRQLLNQSRHILLMLARDDYDGLRSEEVSYFLNETLFDAMDELAPEGFYFGAHPGDGSDFGYWRVEEEV